MVADLCHVVLSCFRDEKAKRRHAKPRHMVTFSCFRMATFRPATRKYDTFHVSPFRLLFVVSLPGWRGERSPRENTKSLHVAGFRVATFRPARRRYDTFISGEFSPSIIRVFAWRGERSPRENTPILSLKCRDFVFHFRIFAFYTKKVTFRVFDLSPSGAHAHMVGFKYTLCVPKTIRHRKTRPNIRDFAPESERSKT